MLQAYSKQLRQNGSTRMTKSSARTNTAWLLNRLEELGMSQRELARTIKLDVGGTHKLLYGTRKLHLDEIPTLASALQVGTDTILEVFGIPEAVMGGKEVPGRQLSVDGWLDGTLTSRKEGVKGKRTVTYPFSERDVHCVRFQTAGSEFGVYDGALCFYRVTKKTVAKKASKSNDVDMSLIGKLAMILIVGEKEFKLRELRRGYALGEFNLAAPGGRVMEEGVEIEAAHPVVWIKMG
jgi:hypothetical protein